MSVVSPCMDPVRCTIKFKARTTPPPCRSVSPAGCTARAMHRCITVRPCSAAPSHQGWWSGNPRTPRRGAPPPWRVRAPRPGSCSGGGIRGACRGGPARVEAEGDASRARSVRHVGPISSLDPLPAGQGALSEPLNGSCSEPIRIRVLGVAETCPNEWLRKQRGDLRVPPGRGSLRIASLVSPLAWRMLA